MTQETTELTRAVNRLADGLGKVINRPDLIAEAVKEESPTPLKEKGQENNNNLTRAREEEFADRLFDEFWAKYPKECPRKVGKKKCRAKYALLMRNAKDSTALHAAILARLNARPCRPVECPLFAAKEGGAA